MKNIAIYLSALVALLFSVAETSAQITPPYYNPANVRITGGNINGTTVGETTPANATASRLRLGAANDLYLTRYAAKQVMISGDGVGATTNAGFILGYYGVSSLSGIWSSTVVPSNGNYALAANATDTYLNGVSGFNLHVNALPVLIGSSALITASKPVSVTDTTDSSSATTGSLKTAGGLGVAKKSYFGDSLNVAAPGTISVGSGSTTSAGLIAGYHGASGYGAIWSTGVTPSTTNYSLVTNGAISAQNGSTSSNLNVAGNAILETSSTLITGNVPIKLKGYTVATLPAAGTAGRLAYVTDATAPTYNGALVGGGAVVVPVFDNGTAWVSH